MGAVFTHNTLLGGRGWFIHLLAGTETTTILVLLKSSLAPALRTLQIRRRGSAEAAADRH